MSDKIIDEQAVDEKSAGLSALGFFFPLIGLIMYLVFKDEQPIKAADIGKWAFIGLLVRIGFILLGIN